MLNNIAGILAPVAPQKPSAVDYLVIAGGGGGGGVGGGGGGGYKAANSFSLPSSFTVTIGAGGTKGGPTNIGSNGVNSVFSSITSTGGGGGGA